MCALAVLLAGLRPGVVHKQHRHRIQLHGLRARHLPRCKHAGVCRMCCWHVQLAWQQQLQPSASRHSCCLQRHGLCGAVPLWLLHEHHRSTPVHQLQQQLPHHNHTGRERAQRLHAGEQYLSISGELDRHCTGCVSRRLQSLQRGAVRAVPGHVWRQLFSDWERLLQPGAIQRGHVQLGWRRLLPRHLRAGGEFWEHMVMRAS